jgi:hypothetical protein
MLKTDLGPCRNFGLFEELKGLCSAIINDKISYFVEKQINENLDLDLYFV